MAEALLDRIESGDIDALLDPALPLHLLGDPRPAENLFARVSFALVREFESIRTGQPYYSAYKIHTSVPRFSVSFQWAREERARLSTAPVNLDAALAVLERFA